MSWIFLWCIATYSEWICNILFPWTEEKSNRVFHSVVFKAALKQHLPLALFRVIVFMSQHMLPSVFCQLHMVLVFSPSASLPLHIFLGEKKFCKTCLHTQFTFLLNHMHACVLGHNLLPALISAAWFNQISQLFKNFYSRILYITALSYSYYRFKAI